MKQKNMAQPPTITQTLQADRITWLQIPTTFHEKGGGGRERSLKVTHLERLLCHRRLFPGLQAECGWLSL